jgi:hypothetical protein
VISNEHRAIVLLHQAKKLVTLLQYVCIPRENEHFSSLRDGSQDSRHYELLIGELIGRAGRFKALPGHPKSASTKPLLNLS